MPDALQLNLRPDQTGLTLSAKLMTGGAVAATVSLTESGTVAGHYYAASISGLAAGTYGVRVVDGSGTLYGTGSLVWDGTAEVTLANVPIKVAIFQAPTP